MKISPEFLMIQEVSSAVIHEKDVEELLNKVLCILAQRMGMMRGTFTLLFGDTLAIEASHGIEARRQKLGQYRMGEGITGMVAENGKRCIVPDLRKDARFLNRTGSHTYPYQVAFICVPLIQHNKVIGTLSIDRQVESDSNLEQDAAIL